MQQMSLWIFWAIVGAFIVCGGILTRKPTKKPPTETLRTAVPDKHQLGAIAGGGSGTPERAKSFRAQSPLAIRTPVLAAYGIQSRHRSR
jgi:hypothetical protein